MAEGNQLHLRLFLEGIEIPVVAASVQMAANTPASASIQVIATDKVLDLLPRTVVHLFYFDYIQQGNVAVEGKVKGGDEYRDWFNSRYKLLFMGELVTIKFQKTHQQRAVVLECADFSNYWDTTFQYNFGGSLFGGRRKAAFIGANSNFFTSPLGHGTGTISRLLSGRSVNFPQLRGLLAGVVRMLEAIGGSYYGRNTFRGANDFTSVAELRLKVLQQITAAEADTSTAKLFARKAFNMWMNRATQSLGKLVSFRGLVKTCFGFIFHEVYPCPVAKYVPGSTKRQKRRWSVGLGKTKYSGFNDRAKACLDLAVESRQNLQAWRKSKLGASSTANKRRSAAATYIKSWAAFNRSAASLAQQGMASGPKKAQKDAAIVGQTASNIKALSTNAGGVIRFNPVTRETGEMDRNFSAILTGYIKAENALKRILGIKVGRSKTVTVPTEPRVNNQIFRPDVWYAPPPRCNVIFPEMYDSFSFARQYLREVSRLELQTHNEILGNDALFNGRYYAPNVEDVRRGVKLSSRRFARLIMDHELFTGIIPMFENLSEANLFAMRSGKVKKAGAKVSYAQRAVNFQYFKYRFESRGMDASGRFNPPFVPGFPSLIVDKNMDHAQLHISSMNLTDQTKALGIKGSATRSELLQELVSPQYLAVCAALSHTVSQEGGRSAYQLIHARVHRESTEFLGVDKADVWKVVGESAKKTVAAAPVILPPIKGQRGPRGGRITRVRDVSKKYKGRQLRLLGQGSKVTVGDWYPDWYFQDVHVDKGSQLLIGAYEIQEGYTRRKKEKVDLPIEEVIRPPWIWDGWANPKISETYDQLFGTGAVTDIGGFNISSNDPSEGTRFYVGEDDVEGLRAQRSAETHKSLRGKSRSKKNDIRQAAKVEAAKSQNAVLMQEKERTVENSVDFLVRAYSFVKVNNLDVGDFLKAYAWRPVATMVDILGGSDLEIKQVEKRRTRVVKQRVLKTVGGETTTGKPESSGYFTAETGFGQSIVRPQYSTKYVKRIITQIGYEVTGKEGFHSRAFGDVEDLFGLVSPTVKRVLGLSNKKRKVAAKMDVRKRRREVVRLYVAELTGSRGLLG
jgi:hypothetical protein